MNSAEVASSVPLTSEEERELAAIVAFEQLGTGIEASPLPDPETTTPPPRGIGLQPAFGLDMEAVWVLLLAQLSLSFFKSLGQESGEKFWDAVLALHRKIAARFRSTKLRGLQTRFRPRKYKGVPLEIVMTLPHALYSDPEPLAKVIRDGWATLPQHETAAEALVDSMLASDATAAAIQGKRVVIHGVVHGGTTNWDIAVTDDDAARQ